MLTCENGVFQSPVLKSLVEQLLESPSHGAAACLASAGLSSFVDGEYMGAGFFQALLIERVTRIGDALIAGYDELN